jgi:hypothetical protein
MVSWRQLWLRLARKCVLAGASAAKQTLLGPGSASVDSRVGPYTLHTYPYSHKYREILFSVCSVSFVC